MSRASKDDVMRFIRAVCPEAPDLYLASFDEKRALNDAAHKIESLEREIEEQKRREMKAKCLHCGHTLFITEPRMESPSLETRRDDNICSQCGGEGRYGHTLQCPMAGLG